MHWSCSRGTESLCFKGPAVHSYRQPCVLWNLLEPTASSHAVQGRTEQVKCRHCTPGSLPSCGFWERHREQDCMSVYAVVKDRQISHFLIQSGHQTLTKDILLYHQAWLFLVEKTTLDIRKTWFLSDSYILHQLFHKAAITLVCMQ